MGGGGLSLLRKPVSKAARDKWRKMQADIHPDFELPEARPKATPEDGAQEDHKATMQILGVGEIVTLSTGDVVRIRPVTMGEIGDMLMRLEMWQGMGSAGDGKKAVEAALPYLRDKMLACVEFESGCEHTPAEMSEWYNGLPAKDGTLIMAKFSESSDFAAILLNTGKAWGKVAAVVSPMLKRVVGPVLQQLTSAFSNATDGPPSKPAS